MDFQRDFQGKTERTKLNRYIVIFVIPKLHFPRTTHHIYIAGYGQGRIQSGYKDSLPPLYLGYTLNVMDYGT